MDQVSYKNNLKKSQAKLGNAGIGGGSFSNRRLARRLPPVWGPLGVLLHPLWTLVSASIIGANLKEGKEGDPPLAIAKHSLGKMGKRVGYNVARRLEKAF